jgi:hypothetical protein
MVWLRTAVWILYTSSWNCQKLNAEQPLPCSTGGIGGLIQRYTEITHYQLLFSVAQGIFWLSTERLLRSTLHLKEGGEGSLHSCTLQSCNCDVLHRPLCADSDRIPEGGTSTYIPHLSGLITIQITATVIPLYTSAELGVTPVRNDTLFAFGLFRRMNGITVFQKLYSSK